MATLIEETLGQMVKRLRKERNWSKKKVAGMCNCEPRTIRRIEEDICEPSLSTAIWLAVVFDISLDVMVAKQMKARRSLHEESKKIVKL